MRQLFILTALLSLAVTSASGCRSLDGYQTAARGNRPDAAAGDLADRSATITLQRIEPAVFDSIGHSPVSVSLVGIIADDLESGPPPADVETFDPIDIVPQPQPELVSIKDGGHSQVSDRQIETSMTCRDCDSGHRGYRPDAPLTWTDRQPAIYEHPTGPVMHAIRIGDELEIKFPHKPLFSEKVMVREDGMIAVPLIEPVLAAGLTPEMLQAELAKKYRALQYDPSNGT